MHLRAFAPYALPFLALGVMSATIWRTWAFRASAIPFAVIGLIGATQGPRYDVIVPPSGDEVAVRDADGRLTIVGKRFNAFAAEQWLTADGDGRDPASGARRGRALRPVRLRRRPAGRRILEPRPRSVGFRRGLHARGNDRQRAQRPGDCEAKFVLDDKALARLGAVGLT